LPIWRTASVDVVVRDACDVGVVVNSYSLSLMLVSLVGFAVWLGVRRRLSPPVTVSILSLLAVLAFIGHIELVRSGDDGIQLKVSPPHANEFLLYYLGTKYFGELGYTGLYDAGVVADHEDAPDEFQPDGLVRDLTTYRVVHRGSVIERADAIKAPFSPERWSEFKRDLAPIRDLILPEVWHRTGCYVDHGYNGTPLTTALLGGLAHQSMLDTAHFIALARFFDLYLLVLLAALIAGIGSVSSGLCFALLLFANPMNDHNFVGSAYLRFDYLAALAVALIALRGRWFATSGALLSVSGWLRIFPLAVPAMLLARDLMHRDRSQLREHLPLYISFALASLVILGGTSLVDSPDGRNPWGAFVQNMRLHTSTLGGNQIGLQVPLRYSKENDVRMGGERVGDAPVSWRPEVARVLHERRIIYYAAAVLLVVAALYGLWRGEAGVSFTAGMLVVFASIPLAHYYYAVLALTPLALGFRGRVLVPLAVTLTALCVTRFPSVLTGREDLRFALMSLEILAFLLIVTLWQPAPESQGDLSLGPAWGEGRAEDL
jgi:hypothetical protein